MKVIGVDVDGVLANFNEGYRAKLFEVSNRDLIAPGFEPPCWDYPKEYGYSDKEVALAWKAITASETFWEDLDALPGACDFLHGLALHSLHAEVYYLTVRPGDTVKQQTEDWLEEYGHDKAPTVVIARNGKGGVAASVGMTHLIDDRPENCFDVKLAHPECDVFLLAARYNGWAHTKCDKLGIHIIPNFTKFEDAIYE